MGESELEEYMQVIHILVDTNAHHFWQTQTNTSQERTLRKSLGVSAGVRTTESASERWMGGREKERLRSRGEGDHTYLNTTYIYIFLSL